MQRLSVEQQALVESSLWVVNTVLKKHGLSHDNDMRQEAILYMCKCALRFDPTRHIKWGTFAYKNINLFVKSQRRKEYERNSCLTEYDHLDYTERNMQVDSDQIISKIDTKLTYKKLTAVCTEKEKAVLELKREGYTGGEIAKIMGCGQSTISHRVAEVKKKSKNV